MIAKVVFNNKEHNIDKFFDYLIPQEFESIVKPGVRVSVPLGKGNMSARGIVVEVNEHSDFKELKSIKSCVDENPICSEKMIKLCMWIKKKCFCSFYQALRLVIPPGMESGVKSKTEKYITLIINDDNYDEILSRYEKKNAKNFISVINCLKKYGTLSVTKLYQLSSGNSQVLSSLLKSGYISVEEKIVERKAFDRSKIKSSSKVGTVTPLPIYWSPNFSL